MTSQWARLESLYHQAAALPASERTAFLDRSCESDPGLRTELEAMLRHAGTGFLEKPGDASAGEATGPRLAPGTVLGAYEIHTLLGVGGMGEVYRATDTTLGRDVAVKILPASFTTNPDRVARFRREAEVLASLNHPHIAQIYGLGEADGTQFLVLELVQGETLDRRIARGALPLAEARRVANEIADALEAAHQKGIVHRDLKPANIAVDQDGTVKVLDFGLAKPDASGVADTLSRAATQVSPPVRTAEGVRMGTVGYMSPEQANGLAVDKRSDVWSFGCVLYEMLTGRAAFTGSTPTDVLAAVVRDEPDWAALPTRIPPDVRRLLERCLAKNRAERIGDLAVARFVLSGTSTLQARGRAAIGARRAIAVSSAFFVGIAAASAVLPRLLRHVPVPPPVVQFQVTPDAAEAIAIDRTFRSVVALAPDGSYLVYRGGQPPQLFIRWLERVDVRPLEGTAGALEPFVSPDGGWIGFFVQIDSTTFEIRKVPIKGGPPVTICQIRSTFAGGGTWLDPDTIAFHDVSGLERVAAAGGQPRVFINNVAETLLGFPSALPNRRGVVYTQYSGTAESRRPTLAVFDFATSRSTLLPIRGSQPQYVDSGHLVFESAGSIRAIRFDLDRLELRGEATPVIDGVLTNGTLTQFAASPGGTFVYVPGERQTEAVASPRSLVWVSRDGQEQTLDAPRRAYGLLRLSPDGSKAALDIRDQQNDIWIWNFSSHVLSRFTFDPAADRSPIWTPDGRRIIFSSLRSGVQNLYWQAADGTGAPERLTDDRNGEQPRSLSPDGAWLTYDRREQNTTVGVAILGLRDRQSGPTIKTTGDVRNPDISPDGHWVAYQSDESGRFEVYVQPFPDVNSGRWQVSADGGTKPAWSRDGREIFFLGERSMKAVEIKTGSTFHVGAPITLFDTGRYFSLLDGRSYDPAANGKRFLMISSTPTSSAAKERPLTLVVTEHLLDGQTSATSPK